MFFLPVNNIFFQRARKAIVDVFSRIPDPQRLVQYYWRIRGHICINLLTSIEIKCVIIFCPSSVNCKF